jgi:hypothetical protein
MILLAVIFGLLPVIVLMSKGEIGAGLLLLFTMLFFSCIPIAGPIIAGIEWFIFLIVAFSIKSKNTKRLEEKLSRIEAKL